MISDKNIRIVITVPKSLNKLTEDILEQIPGTTKSRLYICAMTTFLNMSALNNQNQKGEENND